MNAKIFAVAYSLEEPEQAASPAGAPPTAAGSGGAPTSAGVKPGGRQQGPVGRRRQADQGRKGPIATADRQNKKKGRFQEPAARNPGILESTVDDVLASQENLTRFLAIAETLGQRHIFKELEDITVLAVSNDVELASWEAEIASDPDPMKHIDRLKRHVLTESQPFEAMENVQPVPTLSEEILVISHRDGGRVVVFDDDSYELAQIVKTDLEASNGVIHVVDRILVRHADSLRA